MNRHREFDAAREIKTGAGGRLLTMATPQVVNALDEREIDEAFGALLRELEECNRQCQAPIEVSIAGQKLWGIIDPWAGPNGEDLLTLLYPNDN